YFFLTYGLISIPAGKLVDRIGYKNGMVVGFFIAASGALIFFPASLLHQYAIFLAALFIIAMGIVLLQVAANPYVTILGPARTASSRLVLIQGVGSVGTTVAPLLGARFILQKLSESSSSGEAVRYPYLGIAVLLVTIGLVVARLKLPQIKAATRDVQEKPVKDHKTVFSFRNLNFGIVAIFLYVGSEVSIGTFLTNYISDTLHIAVRDANSFVAFYWGGMLVGRFAGSVLLQKVRPPLVLSICAGLAMALIIFSLNSAGYAAVWSMIAVGLCNSIIFATIFSLSVRGVGEFTTRASGLLSTAIFGGAIISFTVGFIKDHYTWKIAFLIPVICYLYIFFYGRNGYKSKLAGAL
ncbi:MAG TPA: sugar MFS transporter, partial [Puia sp.]|nr:sugar MFS transporter [Puia sp.]